MFRKLSKHLKKINPNFAGKKVIGEVQEMLEINGAECNKNKFQYAVNLLLQKHGNPQVDLKDQAKSDEDKTKKKPIQFVACIIDEEIRRLAKILFIESAMPGKQNYVEVICNFPLSTRELSRVIFMNVNDKLCMAFIAFNRYDLETYEEEGGGRAFIMAQIAQLSINYWKRVKAQEAKQAREKGEAKDN